MKLALDTNRYSDLDRGDPEASRIVRAADSLYLPLPVLAELLFGFRLGSRMSENMRRLREFLATPRVHVLAPDEQTAHEYAKLMVQVRGQGTPLPINDLWIAALVVQHNLVLFARDKHFDHLPQIERA